MFKSSLIPRVIITQDVHEPFILDYNAKSFVLVFQLSIPKNGFHKTVFTKARERSTESTIH